MDSQRPEVLDLARELFQDIQARFIPYFLGGLGVGLVQLPITVVGVFLLYGFMFGGMLPGMMANDEGLMMLGMFGGLTVGMAAMVLCLTVVIEPLRASLGRAMLAHLNGEVELSIGAAFGTATHNLVPYLLYTAMHVTIGVVLTLFCYIPGILWFFVMDFAWCKVVLDDEKPIDAMKWAVADVQEHLTWHLGYFALLFGIALIVSYLPLIGMFLAPSMTMAWRIYAFNRVANGAPAIGSTPTEGVAA